MSLLKSCFKLNQSLIISLRSYSKLSHHNFSCFINSRTTDLKLLVARPTPIVYSGFRPCLQKIELFSHPERRSALVAIQLFQRKQFSTEMANAAEEFRHLDYAQLMEVRSKEPHVLIDVREKSELQETGSIPGAYHIPVGEIEKAFTLPDDEFKKTYSFSKPSTEDQVIFSCRSGKRSFMALEKVLAKGYTKAKHYKGGWLDWEQNSGSRK